MKLKNNFFLFHIINPIKWELWNIAKFNRKSYKKSFKSFNISLYKNKNIFKSSISFIKINFITKNFTFYKLFYTFINYGIYDFKKYIKMYIFKKYKKSKLKKRFKKSLYYFNLNKFIKIYFYFFLFLSYFREKLSFYILKIIDNKKTFNLLLLNILNIYNNIIYMNIQMLNVLNNKIINISAQFLKFYLYYNYINMLWSLYKPINKRNIRSEVMDFYKNNIVGYKMGFYGRFSRRQKASHIWFSHGRVPLNTININVDYSFFTVPIKNSAVSIKIWIYKNKFYSSFKYILKC